MYILGISCFFHDSAACLIRDGEILAAAQEERFTRIKHDPRFPKNAVKYCLTEAGISVYDLTYIVYYEKPILTFERLLLSYLSVAPKGLRSWIKALPLWICYKLYISSIIRKEIGFKGEVLYSEHHISHAASAFYPSPFSEAAILTMDGVGEWTTTSYGIGKNNDIEIYKELDFPNSLGLLYSAFTYYLGFKVNSDEYKLMGLSSYGVPRYKKLILSILIDLKEDGSFCLDLSYFDFLGGLCMTNKSFDNIFSGPPRRYNAEITQREMDIAASIQTVLEEIVLRMVTHIHKETGQECLCVAGGVALNCILNSRIFKEGSFKNIWIQPAAGDAGGAIGAALSVWYRYLEKERPEPKKDDPMQYVYLGPSFSSELIINYLNSIGSTYHELNKSERAQIIAQQIAEEKIIGYMAGRMEFGPRALGARSILGDPRSIDIHTKINLKVKSRESFRPLAPTVLEDKMLEYFDLDRPSPYMLLVSNVQKKRCINQSLTDEISLLDRVKFKRSDIPAVTHIDYSARIQTLNKNDNPDFYEIISKFEKITGYALLVNTSFNVLEEPIVCTPEDAYRSFMLTDIDVLVMGDYILFKEEQSPWIETANIKGCSDDAEFKKIRKTGLISLFIFGSLCFLDICLKNTIFIYLFCLLSILATGLYISPRSFKPVYVTWINIIHFINNIFVTIILTLTFYFIITPTALIKSYLNGRPIPIRPQNRSYTYWVSRDETAQNRERFLKRY